MCRWRPGVEITNKLEMEEETEEEEAYWIEFPECVDHIMCTVLSLHSLSAGRVSSHTLSA